MPSATVAARRLTEGVEPADALTEVGTPGSGLTCTSVQTEAMDCLDGDQIIACAGSGKTQVISDRFLYGFNAPLAEALGYGKSLHDALAEIHQRSLALKSASGAAEPGY